MFCHVDADAFFASVLVRRDPRLRGKPLIAAGMGGGCVIAASYEAKACGVKTGMPLSEAKKLVPPDCLIRDTDFAEAHTASSQIEERLEALCPTLESASIDEWYMDLRACVGGVPHDLASWAVTLQKEIDGKVGIPVSFGIAPSKLLAKMASPFRKPRGIMIVGNGGMPIDEFLQKNPAGDIPGLGWRRSVHAEVLGWKTAYDVSRAPLQTIVRLFGRPGVDWQRELNGEARSGIEMAYAAPKSISRCRSFPKTNDALFLKAYLFTHLSYTLLKMRHHSLAVRRIGLWLRDDRYRHEHADRRLPQPVTTEEQLLPYVEALFSRLYDGTQRYTQAGLVLSELSSDGSQQYSLFEEPEETKERERLQETLDMLRGKFGRDVVRRGASSTLRKHEREMRLYE